MDREESDRLAEVLPGGSPNEELTIGENVPATRALSRFLAGVLAACVTSAAEPSGAAIAAERFPRGVAVKCGNKECGRMVISRYRNFRDGDPTPTNERYTD